jgi:hypothetical protein
MRGCTARWSVSRVLGLVFGLFGGTLILIARGDWRDYEQDPEVVDADGRHDELSEEYNRVLPVVFFLAGLAFAVGGVYRLIFG